MPMRPLKFLLFAAILLWTAVPLKALTVGRMHIVDGPGGVRLLQVTTAGLATPRLQSVDGKVVIVIPGGDRALKTIQIDTGPVARIRFGKAGQNLHIVLDLRGRVRGKLTRLSASGFFVELDPETATAKPAEAGTPGSAIASDVSVSALAGLNPARVGYTYRVVDLTLAGDDSHSELVVSADGPVDYASSVREGGRLLRLDFHDCSLAWSGSAATLKDDAISFVEVRQIRSAGESRVRLDIHLTGILDYAFRRDQNQVVVRLDRPVKFEAPSTKGNMNTPVSLDVQNADLVGVLKTLCEQAGFNYQFTTILLTKIPPESLVTEKVVNRPFGEVLDSLLAQVQCREVRLGNTIYMGTTSEISMRRDAMPLESAFYEPKYLTVDQIQAYLLLHFNNDLDEVTRLKKNVKPDPRDPSRVILVGTPDEVRTWEAYMRSVDVPESGDDGGGEEGGQARTEVFHLEYLDSTNASLITGAIDQLYPAGETPPAPIIDSATRTLVVTTQPRYLRKIAKLLSKIDVRPLQVNIEGRIVEVDQSAAMQLGVNWNSNSTNNTLNSVLGSTGGTGSTGNFNTGFVNSFTSQLSYGTILNGVNIVAQIQALVDDLKAEIVSAPNITTIDNQPATISTIQTQVYLQTTSTITNGVVINANTFPTSNVPLTLVVTPKISLPDRRVLMNINFQLMTTNGTAPAVGAPLPTNQESAVTNVSVRSGDTFVIGGLVKQNNNEEVRKVPILGDIPLIGLLFKYTSTNKAKSEIIIFIKPTIVTN